MYVNVLKKMQVIKQSKTDWCRLSVIMKRGHYWSLLPEIAANIVAAPLEQVDGVDCLAQLRATWTAWLRAARSKYVATLFFLIGMCDIRKFNEVELIISPNVKLSLSKHNNKMRNTASY